MNPKSERDCDWAALDAWQAQQDRARKHLTDELLSQLEYGGLIGRLSIQLGYAVNHGPNIGEM